MKSLTVILLTLLLFSSNSIEREILPKENLLFSVKKPCYSKLQFYPGHSTRKCSTCEVMLDYKGYRDPQEDEEFCNDYN